MKYLWLLLIIPVFLLFKKSGYSTEITDSLTKEKIASLHPIIRKLVVTFVLECRKKGVEIRVFSGYRSYQYQQTLYEQGGAAKPGFSYHNYGLAVDVAEMKGGKQLHSSQANWKVIAAVGKSLGFRWGGDFYDPDLPHFDYDYGFSTTQLYVMYNAGDVDSSGYVVIT